MAPPGVVAKLDANLAALRVLDRCRTEGRWATEEEQGVLARWSGWGAVPQIFDEADDRFEAKRIELRRLLGSDKAWAQARRTTLNAHYTSADVVQAMWAAVARLGFDGGRVLEPGCGSFRSPSVSHRAECLDMLRVRSTRSPSGFPWSGGRSPFSSGILLEWEP